MASTYPGTLDTFATTSPTNLGDDDAQARNHAERHDDVSDAMNKVQAELGTDPADAYATVKVAIAALKYSPWALPMVAGGYFAPATPMISGGLQTFLGEEVASFFIPMRSCTLDRLAIYVNTAGTSGSVVRLGLRAFDASTTRPGALILDAGTVDTTTTGMKETTISQAVTAGTPYILTATAQTGATHPLLYATGFGKAWPFAADTIANSNQPYCYKGSQTGALNDTGSWNTSQAAGTAMVWVRTSTA